MFKEKKQSWVAAPRGSVEKEEGTKEVEWQKEHSGRGNQAPVTRLCNLQWQNKSIGWAGEKKQKLSWKQYGNSRAL